MDTWPPDRYRISPPYPKRFRLLGPEDNWILHKHLDPGLIQPGALWISVHCGPAPDPLPDQPDAGLYDKLRDNWRRRVDCIIRFPSHYAVCEVKPAAGSTALGQVLMYTDLCTRDAPPGTILRPTIITDKYDPDLHELFAAHNVQIFELSGYDYVPRQYLT